MKIRKAYKFRLKTNFNLEHKLWLFAGHCRFVWNYFWRLNQARLEQGKRIMRYGEMDYWSKWLKQSDEHGFLKEAPAHLIQQKLRDLDRSYRDGFDRNQPNKRMPKQRKRQLHSSFRFPSPKQFELENRRVKLPKLGWVGFFKSRDIKGVPKSITISQLAGHWYMSVQVEVELADILRKPSNDIVMNQAIGIDVGIARFATTTTVQSGKVYASANGFKRIQEKLAIAQRKLKHKEKFSNNWKKQTQRIARLHHRASNIRHDHLHKVSTEISKNHALIIIEDLRVSNMSKSAKGSMESPGKSVKAKSGLNRSILDQGWSRFRQQLEYKSAWRGGKVIAVNPQYTSQACSYCGHKAVENRQTQSRFECISCGFVINADMNAARNILAAGLCRVGLCSEPHRCSAAETCSSA